MVQGQELSVVRLEYPAGHLVVCQQQRPGLLLALRHHLLQAGQAGPAPSRV